MTTADLEHMSNDELWALHEAIGKLLTERLTAELREMKKRLAELERYAETRQQLFTPQSPD
jgi:DNA-binding protein H-NS